MEKGIKYGAKIINDVSGLEYDNNTINILKKYQVPFVIHHMKENPKQCKQIQNIKMFF